MKKIKVVITGGPSGGKTTLIEALQRDLGKEITVVPEAASILYRGGFPRKKTPQAKKHTQRAICFTQRELEDLLTADAQTPLIICDRGSLDSIAYWPGDPDDFFVSLKTTREYEISRYDWVIHLDTAHSDHYETTNPIRTENHKEAMEINLMIKEAWRGHPHRVIIPHDDDFLSKMGLARKIVLMISHGASFAEVLDVLEAASN